MLDAPSTLAIGPALAALALARPGHGALARWLRARWAATRARQLEDALKHIWDCESRGGAATLYSLAGYLGRSGSSAARLLARLEHQALIEPRDGGWVPSEAGRSEALRVLRAHRLWESYLAEETGLPPRKWHGEADRREHTTTPEQAEALAAHMGQPRYDPHGDPIPTAAGEVRQPPGSPLSELEEGTLGEIVHVEDEPAEVYARILEAGLYPGMIVRVVERSARRIRVAADGVERVLAPVVAANLTVAPRPSTAATPGPRSRLSTLAAGERARIEGLSPACRGATRRRLLDLGLVPGTLVEAVLEAPGGDPTAYRIRGALVALRREQADLVQIDPVDGAQPEMASAVR